MRTRCGVSRREEAGKRHRRGAGFPVNPAHACCLWPTCICTAPGCSTTAPPSLPPASSSMRPATNAAAANSTTRNAGSTGGRWCCRHLNPARLKPAARTRLPPAKATPVVAQLANSTPIPGTSTGWVEVSQHARPDATETSSGRRVSAVSPAYGWPLRVMHARFHARHRCRPRPQPGVPRFRPCSDALEAAPAP